jgi:hypothetical protein
MRNQTVCVAVCAILAAACGGKKDKAGEGGDEGGGETKKPGVTATCADMPGSMRTNLKQTADGATTYYVEAVTVKVDGVAKRRLDLFRYDVASSKGTLVVEDVSDDYFALGDGTLVFSREGKKHDFLDKYEEQIFAMTPGADPVALTKPGEMIGGFAVDEESGSLVYCGGSTFADTIYKVPLAGGDAQKIGDGYEIYGLSAKNKGVYVNQFQGAVAIVPLAGGEAISRPLIEPGGFLAEIGERIIMIDSANDLVTLPAVGGAPDSAPAKLDIPKLTDMLVRDSAGRLLITGRHDGAFVAFLTDGNLVLKQVTTTAVRIGELIEVEGGRKLVMARHDTNGDGKFEVTDESDLCTIPPHKADELVRFESRTVPKKLVPTAAKLAALLDEADLEGSKLRIVHSELSDISTVVLESPASGATDIAALHARARDVQKRITELSGSGSLDVSIRYRGNGRRADSRWSAPAATFLATAGFGSALLSDASEYSFELDPAVKITVTEDPYSYGQTSSIGKAVCSGTVKNTTAQTLDEITVECTNETVLGVERETAALKPTKLEAGASGKYTVVIPVADGDGAFPITLLVDGKPAAYRNAYAETKIGEMVNVASDVQAATGFGYLWTDNRTAGPSYDRKTVRVVVVRVPSSFAAAALDEQARLAASAAEKFGAYYADDEQPMELAVELVEHDSEKTGWMYRNGVLNPEEDR